MVTYGYQGGEKRLSAGNLTSITEIPGPRGDGDCPLNPTLFSYNTWYNQVTSITYPNGLKVMNSSPDDNGNFQMVSTMGSGDPGFNYTYMYKYNEYGQIESETDSYGASGIYTYTTFDELHTENQTAAFSLSPLTYKGVYGYDPNGNLSTMETAYGSEGNQLSSSCTYTYTSRDMLWTETDMDRGITTTYTYDNNDNLESISNGSN